jgi:serine/threonine protein kinase
MNSEPQKKYYRLLALLGKDIPGEFDAEGVRWRKIKAFKHDFFAATGLYESEKGKRAVLKIFRPYSYMGIPYGLLSRWQASHEEKVYKRLQDTGCVPKWIGRFQETGIIHEYIPGNDLSSNSPLRDNFFEELEKLLRLMHSRGMSYLDTNKPDNILVGDDGKPYLIDFQITWVQPPFPLNILTYPLFHMFKNSDIYHLRKHMRKFSPGSIADDEFEKMRPWYIKLHRLIATPIRRKRRKYLHKVEKNATHHPEGAERH